MDSQEPMTALVQMTLPRVGFLYIKACTAAITAGLEQNHVAYAMRHTQAAQYVEQDRDAVVEALRVLALAPCGNPECPVHSRKSEPEPDQVFIVPARASLSTILHECVRTLTQRSPKRAEAVREELKDILAHTDEVRFILVLGEAIAIVMGEIENTLPRGWRVDMKQVEGEEWFVMTPDENKEGPAAVARDLQG